MRLNIKSNPVIKISNQITRKSVIKYVIKYQENLWSTLKSNNLKTRDQICDPILRKFIIKSVMK